MTTDAPPRLALGLANLRKSYATGMLGRQRKVALEGLTLDVPAGEIFGCLGPNGSGKTTTLRIIMGLCRADAGSVSVLGLPHADPAWRARVGYVPEQPYLYDHLTCREYLDYLGRLLGLPKALRHERVEALIDRVGLRSAADQRLRGFSKGMQQRTALAQALLGEPELIFLDEPMSGLDPMGRHLVRELITDLRRQGRTVFFSTHILSDAESLCDRVALLRLGRLLAVGPLSEILPVQVAHLEMLVTGVTAEALRGFPTEVVLRDALGERLRLNLPEAHLGRAVVAVEQAGGHVLQVHPVRQSLEEYFVKEMGKEASGDLA
jgi:ABC-2 type transport system ATP-binding protein